MDRRERVSRRDAFLADATTYRAARPDYPEELLKQAVDLAGLEPGHRLLEVGCGTGQATAWFAKHGFDVLAIDRSAAMVDIAKAALAAQPNVEVRAGDFEGGVPSAPFRGLIAATSFHWLDPDSRVDRCASALLPGGGLILLWHTHPQPFTGYFERVQPIYRRYLREWTPPPSPGMTAADLSAVVREIEKSGRFRDVARRAVDWEQTYSRDEYFQLLATYSDHRLLDTATRSGLLSDLAELIDGEFGGEVVKPYRSEAVIGIRAE